MPHYSGPNEVHSFRQQSRSTIITLRGRRTSQSGIVYHRHSVSLEPLEQELGAVLGLSRRNAILWSWRTITRSKRSGRRANSRHHRSVVYLHLELEQQEAGGLWRPILIWSRRSGRHHTNGCPHSLHHRSVISLHLEQELGAVLGRWSSEQTWNWRPTCYCEPLTGVAKERKLSS